MSSKFGVLPTVKVILSATQARLALSASPRFCYLFTAHSSHPYLQISFHRPISPVQHRALYKKNHYVAMYKLPLGSIYESVRFLNPVCLLTALACVAVHTLACSYHHHSFAAFFHSFTVLALCVYFLTIVLSRLLPVVCLFLIGPRQRDICSAVLVLRNL